MINEYKSFRRILRDFGHEVFIQKRLDDNYNYSANLIKASTRHYFPKSISFPMVGSELPEGIMPESVDIIYFFEHNIIVNTGDRIYDKIVSGMSEQSVFLVDIAIPVRGHRKVKGKSDNIVFWTVGATRESPV